MNSPEPTNPLTKETLQSLGLWRLAEDVDDFLTRATRSRWSPVQTVEEVVRMEVAERARRSVERRLAAAKLGRFKAMADFEWEWPKRIDRTTVQRVLGLGFLAHGENVVLVAAQGLGKTMIAKNLVHAAVMAGHTALFTTAADLLLDLNKQDTVRGLERRLAHYARPTLLAIDEVGYLAYDNHAADLLFQVVSRRYECRALVVTTNLRFAEWGQVFPNAACATALIDRLTHHAEIISILGESYRKREAELAAKERRRDA